jgi:uncharacterized protein YbaR (Trm112 family)
MFVELLDLLRCPRPHEDAWLVLAATRTDGRDIMEGVLGCPVCQAEYPITTGIARFAAAPVNDTPISVPNDEEAVRLAATLDLTGPRGYAVLVGSWGAHAPAVLALTDVQLLLVNPPVDVVMGHGLSGLTIEAGWRSLPLASSSARAIALDDATTPGQLAAALELLNDGGRVLAPVSLRLPEGLTELARDGRHWVAQRSRASAPSDIVRIGRRS